MEDTREPILVLTTGGTIDKTYFDSQSAYQVGATQVARLLELGRVTRPFEVAEIMRKDSLDLDDQDRARIVARVRDSEAARIIITHGTDTMARTAEALGTIPGRTIVFVGALAPARFSESDAAFNLGLAFATVQIASEGTYITMNGTVFRAGDVIKRGGTFVPRAPEEIPNP